MTKKHKNTALPDDESEDLRLKVIFKYSLINLIRRLDSTKAVACIGVAREEFVLDYKQKAEEMNIPDEKILSKIFEFQL